MRETPDCGIYSRGFVFLSILLSIVSLSILRTTAFLRATYGEHSQSEFIRADADAGQRREREREMPGLTSCHLLFTMVMDGFSRWDAFAAVYPDSTAARSTVTHTCVEDLLPDQPRSK